MNALAKKILREHFAKLGKKGGKVKSKAKTAANKLNAKKPRTRKPKGD